MSMTPAAKWQRTAATVALLTGLAPIAAVVLASPANATFCLVLGSCGGNPPVHTVDGKFDNANEWDTSRKTVTKDAFTVGGISNGAFLYVEQTDSLGNPVGGLGSTLQLMYDFVASPAILGPSSTASNSFFDVFFEVVPDGHDYAVHISNGAFTAYEKPIGTTSPLNPDGSFDLNDGPDDPTTWTPLSSGDLGLAGFQAAIGFGTSPDSTTPHLISEFSLTINSTGSQQAPNGLYDPSPAFWSASSFDPSADPPITSGIFSLNPDGTSNVTPVLGPGGGPVLQPVPEPASLSLIGAGLALFGFAGMRRRRRPT